MNPVRDEQQLCELLGIAFTDEQLAAITAGLDEPGVIIAGAGSGKTSVMAARVVWLVGHLEVPPERVLGLTFTNKAAAELGQRIRASLQLLGADADGEPTTSTYHAFAGSLITEHGLRLGVEPDLTARHGRVPLPAHGSARSVLSPVSCATSRRTCRAWSLRP